MGYGCPLVTLESRYILGSSAATNHSSFIHREKSLGMLRDLNPPSFPGSLPPRKKEAVYEAVLEIHDIYKE